jgi:hypothetical protein
MNIIPLPEGIDPDFFRVECLLKEGRCRLKQGKRANFQTLLLPAQLNFCSTKLIASLVLEKLHELYVEDDCWGNVNYYYSRTEKELLQVVCELLQINLPEDIILLAQTFSIEDALEESNNRYWDINRRAS